MIVFLQKYSSSIKVAPIQITDLLIKTNVNKTFLRPKNNKPQTLLYEEFEVLKVHYSEKKYNFLFDLDEFYIIFLYKIYIFEVF